ncbi:hypothetical protein FNV43_RR25847 [Rhamnella rubrinervis]|uniref:DELLA protein RGL1 n=1 Tax=Rhamnella rubrinervis TaxID=2594499 RepID=A0A8K0DHJ1_9ROSA|nr:hypothetical protein FNV43_RR25847 [Rhamnella rubrinervis]
MVALYVQTENHDDDHKSDEIMMGLDINLSSMACLPFSSVSTLKNDSSSWRISSLDETIKHKKQKPTPNADESLESTASLSCGSSSNPNSSPRLRFRDHIWAYTQRYLAVEAIDDAATALMKSKECEELERSGGGDGMKLVQQLISCAEAVACRDKTHALALLSELRANALVFGTPFQRVASCFVQGLSDRLELVQTFGTVGVIDPESTKKMAVHQRDKDEALHLFYELCPQIQFGHFIANASILEAFEGESFVHVIDLGMSLCLPHGYQWRNLMQSLANRKGQVTLQRLRITGVGNRGESLKASGEDLELYAKWLNLNFEFSVVEFSNLEKTKAEYFNLHDGEVLVINSILQLHCVVKERRGVLNSVLKRLHGLSPKLMVVVEQDSSHNGPFFPGRFMEALHYYSAIFDSLDAMLPKYDTRRAKMEQFFFAEEIKNIVSREGPERVERHERMEQWRRRMSRAGFQPAPLKMVRKAKQWVEKVDGFKGYTVMEDKGCLVLGWKSKPIIAASCWKCS